MFIDLSKAVSLLTSNNIALLKVYKVNSTLTWGDILAHSTEEDIEHLMSDKTMIESLFKLANMVEKFVSFSGIQEIKTRSSFIASKNKIGIKFIPKGVLAYKFKEKFAEFCKEYNCDGKVCDGYIYLEMETTNIDEKRKSETTKKEKK